MTTVIILAIVVAVGLLSRHALKKDRGLRRGTAPGKGDTIIHSEYSSGLGGHHTTYKVPKDPQEYAKRFVPKAAANSKGTQK